MPPTSSTLTTLSDLLRLLIMFNFCWVRMVGAYKIHSNFIPKTSKWLEQLRDNVFTVKKHFFSVKSTTSNVSFRIYRTDEMMLKAATTMAAARSARSYPEQQFLIPRPKENLWGHRWVLDKETSSAHLLDSPQ